MQNIRRVLTIAIIALGTVVVFVDQANSYVSRPIRVSYHDLQQKVRDQIDCLADNVYFESKGEPIQGQQAVAMVTMNRVKSSNFSNTICEVVKERKHSVCQFSWWCDGKLQHQALQRAFDRRHYQQARAVALDVYLNYSLIKDITQGALYYHADYVSKDKIGVRNLRRTVKIGQHIFYRV